MRITHDKQYKKKYLHNIVISFVVFLVFLGIALGLFFAFSAPLLRLERIAQDENLPVVNFEITGRQVASDGRFSIQYMWQEDGVTRTGATRFVYSRATADRLASQGYIPLRVSPCGTRIDPNFRSRYDRTFMYTFSIVFLPLIAIAYPIYLTWQIIVMLRFFSIAKKGKDGEGSFIEHKILLSKTDCYQIVFSFVDENNVAQTTHTKFGYPASVVAAACDMKKIPIKYRGEAAFIMVNPINAHYIQNQERLSTEMTRISQGLLTSSVASSVLNMDMLEEDEGEFVSSLCPNCKGQLNFKDRNNKSCPFCGTEFKR